MRFFVLTLILTCACGGPDRTASAPAHTSAKSPQATTRCPTERQLAQAAREDLLEFGDSVRKNASQAVFEQAECERRAFESFTPSSERHDELLRALSRLRSMYNDTRNLYTEVVRHAGEEAPLAQVRLGSLNELYANKLRTLEPPADLRSQQEQAEFTAEIAALATRFDRRARASYLAALRTHRRDTQVAWVETACSSLSYLDPDAFGRQTVCH